MMARPKTRQMQVPLIPISEVYHIGSLNVQDAGVHSGGSSYEGKCLSVSRCPHAWPSIARLGRDLYRLSARDRVFVDIVAVLRRKALRDTVITWAMAEGLIVEGERWRAWWYDEETEA